ncbi:MAG: hypothetical protein ACRDK8_08135 [Solirubrobacteraceae bacterium]
MAAYGDPGSASRYEYDHFVPLELGGATNDPRNLWPEPGGSPNRKDQVENYLNREVCDGKMRLARAQRLIVTDWVKLYREIATPKRTSPPTRRRAPLAQCSASAQWNRTYDDWDVYVRSNQPDTDATATGAGRIASSYPDRS